MRKNLANLIKVKTLVTLIVVLVFAVLALRGDLQPDTVMVVVSTVLSFYFGTQHERTAAGGQAPAGKHQQDDRPQ